MGDIERDWFDPARLFHAGYPNGITSALRALPKVRGVVEAEVAALAAESRRILEIGPGDAPLVPAGRPGLVYLDVVPRFLRALTGPRVMADLMAAPFLPGSFDLVVASDVLTHIRPARRTDALRALTALGRTVALFNPEPGAREVAESRSPFAAIGAFFGDGSFRATVREFSITTPDTTPEASFAMQLVVARRR
jgi:methyltransferase family protein